MMLASVVLPSPGGPKISVWSRASPRPRAAAMKISICSRTAGWPMYSARDLGRTARSWASSLPAAPGSISRSVSIIGECSAAQGGFQGEADQFLAAVNGIVESTAAISRAASAGL
jgi:hypothetical protein